MPKRSTKTILAAINLCFSPFKLIFGEKDPAQQPAPPDADETQP